MQHYSCVAVAFGAMLFVLTATSSSSASAIPVIICPPGLKEVPSAMRQLCVAVMERETSPEEGDIIETPLYERHPTDPRGVKRQDVDHVFLRFGRRNGL